jgi:MerR family transcriptional regulator/heat shock protein HspR
VGTRARDPGGGQPPGASPDSPVFVISVAAQLSGLHAQTLRSYDRLGLVSPGRSAGGGRRYSARDIALLREVQRLSQEEGVNLAGIKRIIELEQLVDELRARVDELVAELAAVHDAAEQAAAMVHRSYRRDLVPVDRRHQMVIWHPEHPE